MSFTRRHLPHWFPEGACIFVTWRLAGSFRPAGPLARRDEGTPSPWLNGAGAPGDAGRERDPQPGPDWLRDARLADMMANMLLYGEVHRQFYRLLAWVVMPNHVHVVFKPRVEVPAIMRWLKGRSGRVANRWLGRTGKPFWQDESYDHWIRSTQELQGLIDYVENNPVKAGLAQTKEQWRWSSAGWPGAQDKQPGAASRTDDSRLTGNAGLTDDADMTDDADITDDASRSSVLRS